VTVYQIVAHTFCMFCVFVFGVQGDNASAMVFLAAALVIVSGIKHDR